MVLNYTYFAISEGSSKRTFLESVGVRDDLLTAGGASGASCIAARFGGILAINY
jgi:hypothetical protein